MKKCPYCAEEIQDEAVVCRYCQRDIGTTRSCKIVISRAELANGMLLKMKVIIDGQVVEKLSIMQTKEINVKPGQHELYVKMDAYESKPITINCPENATLYFGARAKSLNPIGNMFRAFNFKNYFVVYPVDVNTALNLKKTEDF